jgi:hypothetical protein
MVTSRERSTRANKNTITDAVFGDARAQSNNGTSALVSQTAADGCWIGDNSKRDQDILQFNLVLCLKTWEFVRHLEVQSNGSYINSNLIKC